MRRVPKTSKKAWTKENTLRANETSQTMEVVATSEATKGTTSATLGAGDTEEPSETLGTQNQSTPQSSRNARKRKNRKNTSTTSNWWETQEIKQSSKKATELSETTSNTLEDGSSTSQIRDELRLQAGEPRWSRRGSTMQRTGTTSEELMGVMPEEEFEMHAVGTHFHPLSLEHKPHSLKHEHSLATCLGMVIASFVLVVILAIVIIGIIISIKESRKPLKQKPQKQEI
ncbi:hypothetical protein V3C99_016082 [Haemonchus contortus]